MSTHPNRDGLKEPRFLLDYRPRNAITIQNHTPLPNIKEGIEFVAARPSWCLIELRDGYYNIRIDTESDKHTTFLGHMGYYRSRVKEQGYYNATATIVRAMKEILSDMIHTDLIIYIPDIIISSRNYKQHVEAFRMVLQGLQDQQSGLKQSKCQFLSKRVDILVHIWTLTGLSADLLEVQKIFDFTEPRDKRLLQGFIAIVNYLPTFPLNVASTGTILADLPRTTRTCRQTDTHLETFN